MSKFSNYSKGKTDFDALASSFKETTSNKKDYDDPRFYYPERDKHGTASVIIRFIPDKEGIEGHEFSKRLHHYFQGKNGWYVANCPRTLDMEAGCPACEAKNHMVYDVAGGWDKQTDSQKEYSYARSWKTEYACNILIVKDDKNPELEGQVKLFRFGKEIMAFIENAPQPKFPDDPAPFNPFNPFTGRNFSLRIIRDEKDQTTYKKSIWGEVNDISEIEAVETDAIDIHELISPDKFLPYKELVKLYERRSGESLASNDTTVVDEPEERSSDPVIDPTEDVSIGDTPDESIGDSTDDVSKYFDDM